jgi:hypothetical protein
MHPFFFSSTAWFDVKEIFLRGYDTDLALQETTFLITIYDAWLLGVVFPFSP